MFLLVTSALYATQTGCEKGDTRCWEESEKQQKKLEGMLAESAEADGDGEGVESTSSSDTQKENVMEELNRLAKLMGMGSIKPYEVLGVPVRATRSEIKRAYRRLSLMLHPDKFKDVS
jgi:DnaJ-domain-containing protein 1